MTTTDTRAAMSSAAINDLPDSAFAYIEPGGTKDASGKTTPRSLRHFPVHDAAHVRNALGRLPSSPFGAKAKAAVVAAAKKFGIDVSSSAAADRAAFELRKRRRTSMIRQMERRNLPFARGGVEVRAKPDGSGGTTFEFEGYGAVFDAPFDMWDRWGEPYIEEVRSGAFTRTLAESPDVPFLIGHNDQDVPLARTRSGTMQLAQDSKGLHVLARMDGQRTDVRNLASAVERGDLDEMSIGFVTRAQEWDEEYEHRSMLDLDLHRGDVSAVALAANPATAGASMTALPTEILSRQAAGEELMLPGTALRLPMIDAALDQAQAIFAKQDLSKMDPDMAQAVELVGSAGIHVDHILKHEGLPDPDNGAASNWSADDPAAEARANAVDTNLGDAPDYNPGPKVVPPPLTCPQCGTRLSVAKNKNAGGGDTLIRLDDSGIPTDESPSSLMSLSLAQAELERRRRELKLLALAGVGSLTGRG